MRGRPGRHHPPHQQERTVHVDDEQTSSTLAALRAEQAGYTARGLDDRAAQVQSQIDAYTGAGAERAAAPPAKRTPRGKQTRG